jgi:hypothetical protein
LPAFLGAFWARLPESAIFGGLIRDFSLEVNNRFKSDIDIVSLASAGEIRSALRGVDFDLNKYGGYRFYVGRRLFDVWSLRDTWAVKATLVKAETLADLRKTTFFNLDAAVLDFETRKVTAYDQFDEDVRLRHLDINLVDHPDPASMALRALKMAHSKNLTLSTRLVSFVVEHIRLSRIGSTSLPSPLIHRLFEHLDHAHAEPFRYAQQLDLWSAKPKRDMGAH